MSYFDYLFYINQYDDLNNMYEQQAYYHYVTFGRKEGRVCNKDLMKMKQEMYNDRIKEQYNFLKQNYSFTSEKKINILIRTSNRPECFKRCINSILNQKYDNFRVFICYDNVNSLDYLKTLNGNSKIQYFFVYVKSKERYKYNLYCNRLKSLVNEGFILYLDDDDELAHDLSLYTINKCLQNDKILVWKFFRSDKLIYPKDLNKITLGEIVSCGFTCHTNNFNNLLWWDKRNGDYNIFCQLLSKKLKVIFIDYILTKNQSSFKSYNNGNKIK